MLNRVFLRIALTVLTLAPAALRADVYTVTRFVDKNDGVCDRGCSLREAILAANQNPGPDLILLSPGIYKLTLAGADEDLGATGDLDITDDLTIGINGPGAVIDGGGIDRVLDIHGQADVQILGTTVRHGVAAGTNSSGGGIRNAGKLTLLFSTVSGNSAPGSGFGGGIFSEGDGSALALASSTVAGNTAGGGGGGITAGGELQAVNSTISGNRSLSDFGGGVYLFSEARASFNNVTLTANRAAQRGGGLFAETPLAAGTPRLANSILAANSAPVNPDCLGASVSGGHNLIGQAEGCPGFTAAQGDRTGTAAAPLDPRLAPLSHNGGLTFTHALLPGSPAINAGSPAPLGGGHGACESLDQRLVQRRFFTPCDIGAFERKARR